MTQPNPNKQQAEVVSPGLVFIVVYYLFLFQLFDFQVIQLWGCPFQLAIDARASLVCDLCALFEKA
jgi:hypothetical protein